MKIYTNKTKLKGLDIPLTDSEIKKLEALEKRMEKGVTVRRPNAIIKIGRDALGKDEDLYDNLFARKNVPQKDFELATIKQIVSIGREISAGRALRAISKNSKPNIYDLKYCTKNQKLLDEHTDAFVEEYKDKLIKMYKGKSFREALFNRIKENFNENDYNVKISEKIVSWIFSIIKKADIDMLVGTDGYKIYQDIEIEYSSESWVSYQGAQMETKKAKVKFSYDKLYENNFELNVSGYWN